MDFLVKNPELANAWATIFTSLTALIALVVSVRALSVQRTHNKVSVKPIPEVTVADFEDSLWVKLCNNGVGPLIVTKMTVKRGTDDFESLIKCMPELPRSRHWTNFAVIKPGRSLRPDDTITLLELTQMEGEVEFGVARDTVRSALSELAITVEYTDSYDSTFPHYVKTLEWFSRNLPKNT